MQSLNAWTRIVLGAGDKGMTQTEVLLKTLDEIDGMGALRRIALEALAEARPEETAILNAVFEWERSWQAYQAAIDRRDREEIARTYGLWGDAKANLHRTAETMLSAREWRKPVHQHKCPACDSVFYCLDAHCPGGYLQVCKDCGEL